MAAACLIATSHQKDTKQAEETKSDKEAIEALHTNVSIRSWSLQVAEVATKLIIH